MLLLLPNTGEGPAGASRLTTAGATTASPLFLSLTDDPAAASSPSPPPGHTLCHRYVPSRMAPTVDAKKSSQTTQP